MIRLATVGDAEAVAGIYNHYIANTLVTFEEEMCPACDMAGRIQDILTADLPWLVAEDATGHVVGYAYASRWNGRCSYRHSVEVTVYLAPEATSRGWGSQLYESLFEQLGERSMHVLIAGIALPNPGSVALHEKFGMEQVGYFREVGFKMDQWIDVGYWQLILDE